MGFGPSPDSPEEGNTMKEDESQEDSIGETIRRRVSRRKFLAAVGIGAAAVGVAAAAPSAVKMASDYLPNVSQGLGRDAPRRLVAYVRDSSKGEIVLMVGEKEIVVRDFGIVSRLFAAAVG